MKFTNLYFEKIWNDSQSAILTKDPYLKLAQFERDLIEKLVTEHFTQSEKLEGHRLLHAINEAQLKILETKSGEDLNGDGRVG